MRKKEKIMLTSLALIFLVGLSTAAICSVPMAMGLACGQIVLSVAVLAILITAPLGAIGMNMTYKKLLERQE